MAALSLLLACLVVVEVAAAVKVRIQFIFFNLICSFQGDKNGFQGSIQQLF